MVCLTFSQEENKRKTTGAVKIPELKVCLQNVWKKLFTFTPFQAQKSLFAERGWSQGLSFHTDTALFA